MSYKATCNIDLQDLDQMTNEMKSTPKKAIWTSGRLATYSAGDIDSGTPPYYYFYGTRIVENGTSETYGSWLVLHYINGNVDEGKNNTNGVRPIIKLNYDIKLKKIINSDGKTSWEILDK